MLVVRAWKSEITVANILDFIKNFLNIKNKIDATRMKSF